MRADLAAGDATRPAVVISTYEQPRVLELALWGYAAQTHREFELVVADDGSGRATREVVERFRDASGLAVHHVRHPDDGSRKSEILNRAILATSADYLIVTRGDRIPRDDFVATHVRLARPGAYVSGTAIRLDAALSERVTVDDVRVGRFADRRWLRAQGWRDWTRGAALSRHPLATALLDRASRAPARFDGGNAATWRALLVAANGFDMETAWGEEDRSLGPRLEQMGVRGIRAGSQAVVVQLAHAQPYRADDARREDRATDARIRRDREVRARRGLAELRSTFDAAAEPAAASRPLHTLPT